MIQKRVDSRTYPSYLASYKSDGLRLYTRIDVPASPTPDEGYPVVIFVHGYRGFDLAPSLNFYYGEDSYYHDLVEAYVGSGFVVLTPGLRGHGSIDGLPAEGIEYMAAWDNGSYLVPVFYAIDVLNLLDGLATFTEEHLNLKRVNLSGHSQGGDVVLTALAIAGEGSAVNTPIHAASIWSGTFSPRFTQAETFEAMHKSSQAFTAGDGTWNGTAVSADGSVNRHFIFGYPGDWIESPHPNEWTWQKETWSIPTVDQAIKLKLNEMYGAINKFVLDVDDLAFQVESTVGDKAKIIHDPRLVAAFEKIDAFTHERLISEKLILQYSDRDLFSPPAWNETLCHRVNDAGGQCTGFMYLENTHLLGVSEHRWFSSAEAKPGFDLAVKRDAAHFSAAAHNLIDKSLD